MQTSLDLPLASDALKVPHNGSKSSSSKEFLDRVAAREAIISVGANNPFGHPHPEVLERLEARGTKIWRTDRDGAIRLRTDGQQLGIGPWVTK